MGTGFIIPSETRLLTEDNPSVSKADQVHRYRAAITEPALLELFDVHIGTLNKIMAFAVKGSKPAWAARWKE